MPPTHHDDLAATRRHEAVLPIAFATAGTADESPLFRAEIAARVTAVRYIPETAITGHGTNYATLSVVNKGATGVGVTAVAAFTFDTPTTDDVAAMDEKALTLETAANLVLAAGDVLAVKKEIAAAGMALDGIIIVEFAPLA